MTSGPAVLIVDDASTVRAILRSILRAHGVSVAGSAGDAHQAKVMLQRLRPDIVLLDMAMPEVDGLTFLKGIMKHQPTPTIVISAWTERGSELALKCLEEGAVSVLPKPGVNYDVERFTEDLCHQIDLIGKSRVLAPRAVGAGEVVSLDLGGVQFDAGAELIAVGASTGGPAALAELFARLPLGLPGIVVAQHMPAMAVESLAKRLNGVSALEVAVGQEGDVVTPGRIYIAPGGRHMKVIRRMGQYRIRLWDGPKVCFNRPSVDVLFESVASAAGAKALAILLTGMGNDGAAGMGKVREGGGYTIAQDESTCVVYGMPRQAVDRGFVCQVSSLHAIPESIVQHYGERRAAG
ncbi:MAG: chemotaxis-specific protein-glutamate methyltransferase CheB [bacterium]|nr:chemotaxis-specific protein-glutamate methyltransferase CheB [bacterium]